MSIRIHVRQGGSSADNPDLANLAEPREGIPIIEGDTPLIEFAQRWEQGTAGRGQFTYVNTDGNADYRFAAHCEVKLIEDASGDDVVLGWGRIEGGDDVGRRTPVGIGDDEIQHNSVGIMDCNVDLRGLPFRNGWSRPAETSWARLQALEAAKLDGSSSSETLRRASTDIRIENFANNHLVDSSDPVDLDAKDYPVGTFVEEVLADILEEWGKAWGVTIHHRLGSSHRCLLVLDPDDLATFTSALRISDQLADHDPDDLSAPTLAPHWRRANGKTSDNGEVISGLISIFGGTTDDPRHLYVETGDPEDEAETWVDVYQDDLAANGTQAERRANHILNDRRRAYSSFQPSILLDPLQVGLITAGQSIEVKSVVYNQGPDRHDWVWVRIAQITWEPAPDGRWWAHLELERPRGTRARAGGGQPRSTNPKPAPSPIPDPGDTGVIDWDWTGCVNPSYLDPFDSTTGNPWGAGPTGPWGPNGCATTTNHNAYSKKWAVTPGDTLHVVIRSGKYGCPGSTMGLNVRFYNSGGGIVSTTSDTVNTGCFSNNSGGYANWATDSADVVVPVGAAYAAVAQGTWSAHNTQQVTVTIPGGDPPESDDEAIDYGEFPHDSPFFLPSDYVEARLDDLQDQITTLPAEIEDGLAWKEPVRVATTANGTLATAFENGDTVDGVALATGDRILLKDQSTGADNGVYTVNASGAPTRATDFDSNEEVIGTAVYVTAGTANADTVWTLTTETPVIGTTALVFTELSGGASDHGALTGLGDDDHTQYLKETDAAAKGDLYAASANDTVGVLSVGSNGQVLTADSGEALGVTWGDPPTGEAYAETIGDGAATSFPITHTLGTTDVLVEVWDVSGSDPVLLAQDHADYPTSVTATDADTVTVVFGSAPATDEYRVVVLASGGAGVEDVVQVAAGAGNIVIPGLEAHGSIEGLGGAGISEEYGTSTSGLTWNVTPSAGVDSDTSIPNALYGEHTFAGAGSIYGLRAWAPGSVALQARAQCSVVMNDSGSTSAFGLMVAASGSTPTNAVAIALNQVRGGYSVNAASLAGTTWTQRGSAWGSSSPVYLRITRPASSDNWAFYWSHDGRLWNFIGNHSLAITIAQVGYRVAASAAVNLRFSSDFLRTTV